MRENSVHIPKNGEKSTEVHEGEKKALQNKAKKGNTDNFIKSNHCNLEHASYKKQKKVSISHPRYGLFHCRGSALEMASGSRSSTVRSSSAAKEVGVRESNS